jgi:hypothetical protein
MRYEGFRGRPTEIGFPNGLEHLPDTGEDAERSLLRPPEVQLDPIEDQNSLLLRADVMYGRPPLGKWPFEHAGRR